MRSTTQVILPEQQLLESSETWTAVLAHIPDASVRQELHSAWTTSKGRESGNLNLARWKELLNKLSKLQVSSIIMSHLNKLRIFPMKANGGHKQLLDLLLCANMHLSLASAMSTSKQSNILSCLCIMALHLPCILKVCVMAGMEWPYYLAHESLQLGTVTPV